MEEVDYCNDPREVRATAGAAEALGHLQSLGWATVIVTNQSGIGRGIITIEQFEAVQAELLRQVGGAIDGSYFCPDAVPSPRRKPATGMIEEAVRDLRIDLERSYFVGDKAIDIECGHRAGMPAVLVASGYGASHAGCGADFEAGGVLEAVRWILEREGLPPLEP